MSDRARSVFSAFKLGEHQFFPVIIRQKEELKSYFVLHIANDYANYINFPKTTFAVLQYNMNSKGMAVIDKIQFNSREEYDTFLDDRKSNRGKKLQPEVVNMDSAILKQSDLFFLGRFGKTMLVSDQLKEALLEHNITGLELAPYKTDLT